MPNVARMLALVLALVVLAGPANAQSKSKGKSAGKPATTPAKAEAQAAPAAVSPSLASLQFEKQELPEGVTPGEGVPCISVQARIYFDDPGYLQPRIPAPVGKVGQSFMKGKTVLGSVMAFEFAEPVSEDLQGFFTGLIWGKGGRSRQHPEELLFKDRFLVMTSFPDGEPLAEWFRMRLQERLVLLGPRDWSSLAPLMDQVLAAFRAGDAAAGMKLLRDDADKVADYAFAQYLLGEFATEMKDYAVAEAAYRRAIEIHDAGTDLLPGAPDTLWAAIDGLALARLSLGQVEQALPALERGVVLARTIGKAELTGRSLYNFACGLARSSRFEESCKALSECLRMTPDYKAMAQGDPDFAVARERPEFRELLGS